MKELNTGLLLYQSIENNDTERFLRLIENRDLKWLRSLWNDPDILYLYDVSFPLELAIKVNNERIVSKLLDIGCSPDAYFENAIRSGNPKIVELLLDAGFKIQTNNNEFLSLAAECGDLDMVKLLIEKGVDINGYNEDYFWVHPLVKSIMEQHICVYEYLLDITQNKDVFNTIALQELSQIGDSKTMSFLLDEKNIDVNATDYLFGSTALIAAVGANQWNVVDYLICVGADVDLQNFSGETALMTAVNQGSITLTKKLLAAGASKDLKDREGNTALDLAIARKDRIIAKFL